MSLDTSAAIAGTAPSVASAGPDVLVGPADPPSPRPPPAAIPRRERRHQQRRGARSPTPDQTSLGDPASFASAECRPEPPVFPPASRAHAEPRRPVRPRLVALPRFSAMPLAMTSSNGPSLGSIADGCGTGHRCGADLLLEAVHRIGRRAGQPLIQHARQRVPVRAYIDVPSLDRSGDMYAIVPSVFRPWSIRRRRPCGPDRVDQVGEDTVGD